MFCPPYISLYNADEIVFYPILVRKNLYKLVYSLLLLNNKFFSMTSSFRNHYNYLFRFFCFIRFSMSILVGPSGLEPPTSCLSGTRSNLLSYEPMWLVWCFTLERFLKSSLSRSENFTLALPKFHSPKANFTLTKSKFHCKAFGFAW